MEVTHMTLKAGAGARFPVRGAPSGKIFGLVNRDWWGW
jgi:hypothetical protein